MLNGQKHTYTTNTNPGTVQGNLKSEDYISGVVSQQRKCRFTANISMS